MAVQLSSLRVSMEGDSSSFVRASDAVEASNKRMAESGLAAGVALAKQDIALGNTSAALGRLSKTYVDGYATGSRFQTAVNSLQRQLELGNVGAERAGVIYTGIAKQYGMVASAAEVAKTGNASFAMVVNSANEKLGSNVVALTNAGKAHAGLSTQAMAAQHSIRSMVEMLAMGVSPTQVLAMQINHLAFAMTAEKGLAGAFGEVATMAKGLIGPWALIAGGLGLAGAAAYSFYENVHRDEQTAEQSLQEHTRLLGLVTTAYHDLTKSAGEFYTQSKAATLLLARQNLLDLQTNVRSSTDDALRGMGKTAQVDVMGNVTGFDQLTISDKLEPFRRAIADLNSNIAAGAPAVTKFRDAIAGIGSANPALQQQAAIILRQTQTLGDMAVNAQKAEAMIRLLTGTATEADKKFLGVATVSANNAFTTLIQKTRDETAELKLEADGAGRSSIEVDRLKREHEFLRAAKEAHITVSESLRAKISAETDAYVRQKQAVALARAQADVGFTGQQIGRTADEQQIATVMRGLYGAEYQSHMNDAIALQMRFNQQMQQAHDVSLGFFQDMNSGLQQGKTVWESFGSAATNVLTKIENKLLDMAFNQVWAAAFPGTSSGFGGILGSLFGGGAAAGTAAPVGVVGAAGPGFVVPTFGSGGYTGLVGTQQVAGVVHGREFVVNADATSRYRGMLEAINAGLPGYSAGGYVGGGLGFAPGAECGEEAIIPLPSINRKELAS
jgi:hypothetical protein